MSVAFVYADKPSAAAELIGIGKRGGFKTFALAFSEEQAQALADCGADGIVAAEGAARPVECSAQGVAELLRQRGADVFLVGASAQGRSLAALAAAHLDCAMSSDVASVELDGAFATVTRAMYGGAVVETVRLPYPAVATVSAGAGVPVAGRSPVEHVRLESDDRVRLLDETPVEKSGADLHAAKVIVAVGMGVGEQADMAMIEALAERLGAGIGCTRGIAESRRWLPVEQYVGLSGEDVAPDLYLAIGVSGQVQHVAGVRGAKIIAAVNSDANAPIFRAADYGVVGDLYSVVPALIEAVADL